MSLTQLPRIPGVTSVSSANADISVASGGTTPSLTAVQTPALRSATTTVNVSAASAPVAGQVLTATSGTAAIWQTPSAWVDHISGLVPTWVSATAIDITPGSAYIESLGLVYVSGATISLTGLTTTATTWYYLYLYDNAGTPAVEVSTTAPAAPYMGTARSKSADTSRRFLGVLKTAGAADTIIKFQQFKDRWLWRTSTGTVFRALSAGNATVATSVSLSVGVPVTSGVALLRVFNLGPSGVNMYTSHGDDVVDSNDSNYLALAPGKEAYVDHPINSSQQIQYLNSATGGSSYIDIYGFTIGR